MANLKRKNHFLPECYQKGFTDASGKAWVKFAAKRSAEHRKPSSVGYRSSLYIIKRSGIEDDKIEDFFSNVVEAPFAPVSQRIKEEQNRFANLTGDEAGAVCGFVASQAVRTLAHKRCVEEQAGRAVDANIFVKTIATQALTLMEC